jgi:hypothetical protein
MFVDFKGKLKECHLQGPEKILIAFQESCDNITFEELQMVNESWCDQLHGIIENDGEYFRNWHIRKRAESWTRKRRVTFSLISATLEYEVSAGRWRFLRPSELSRRADGRFAPTPAAPITPNGDH